MAAPLRRWLARSAVGSLLAAIALLAIAAWWLGSESGLRWAVHEAERLGGGTLAISDASGSLFGPLSIGKLSFRSGETTVEIDAANVDWHPLSLLSGHARIVSISASELRIIGGEDAATPIALPNSLHLPLSFSAPSITLAQLVIINGDEKHAKQIVRDIDFGVESAANRYTLTLRKLSSEFGNGNGELALGDAPPFNLSGRFQAAHDANLAYHANVKVSGSLARVELAGEAQALGGQIRFDAGLAPLAARSLVSARVNAEHLDPRALQNGLPAGELAASIALAQGDDGRIEGDMALDNAAPGPYDTTHLPLKKLKVRLGGTAQGLELNGIEADLAGAGRFSGDGTLVNRKLTLNLNTGNFDPHGVHGKLASLRLAGNIRLQTVADGQRLTADLHEARTRLRLDASHRGGEIDVRTLDILAAKGRLALHGTLALAGDSRFEYAGSLQGFDPSALGDYPAATINASLAGSGQLAGEPAASVRFAIANSSFRHQPLSGRGNLDISAKRVWNSDVVLELARNRLEAKGALGKAADRLDIAITADKLAALDPRLGGRGKASATLEGPYAALSGTLRADIDALSWEGNFRMDKLHASARLEKGAGGPLALDASVQGLTTPLLRLDRASLTAEGTRERHTLHLLARSNTLDLESRLAGGWRDAAGWSGQVSELFERGQHALVLTSAAKLEIGSRRARLGPARFMLAGAEFELQGFAYDRGAIDSRGEFRHLPAAYLARLAGKSDALDTDLLLAGNWRIAAGDDANGTLSLSRERGDIAFASDPGSDAARTTLGLDRLALDATIVHGRVQAKLQATGSRLGNLKADAATSLSRRDGIWGIAGDAPIQAEADLAVESLSWLQAMLGSDIALLIDGALKAHLSAGGSFGKPVLTGAMTGERLAIALPEQGMQFSGGHFQASLQDRALELTEFSLKGTQGRLDAHGKFSFDGQIPAMRLSLAADKLEVLARPDRQLTLSGNGEIATEGKTVKVTGEIKADRGRLEMPKADAPKSSDDVVVIGREKAATAKRSPYALSFGIGFDLGDDFTVSGKGLDARLVGALALTGAPGALPAARGSIRVVKGAYNAYGQRLEIERGIINFQGPVDNPGLNLVALRKNQPVEAGVAVTGTMQSPVVKLVSNPTVPESEKLSWLVLGHGIDNASGAEFSALQTAAGALLATGDSVSLQQKIAHAAGLEEISFKGGSGFESTVLSLGKRLSSRAYLSYEQGLSGADTLIKINYTLTERLSIRAQAGAAPAADLFYTFSFD